MWEASATGYILLSTQFSKTIRGLLLCLLLVGGVSVYNAYQQARQAQILADYRDATVHESKAAIQQTLQKHGLVRLKGVIHTALSDEQPVEEIEQQCFPVNVDTVLESEQAKVEVVDLHHCRTLSKDSDCRAGGQIVISPANAQMEAIYISFNLLDPGQGDFTITIPAKQSLQLELQHLFEQLVDEPRLADREQLNEVLFDLFMNAQTNTLDKKNGQQFLRILLSAVNHHLVSANVFN